MTLEELNQMLNVKPSKQKLEVTNPISAASPSVREGEASPSALKLDKWDLSRGADVRARINEARGSEIAVDELAMADFHTASFSGEPELVEKCAAERRHEFLKTLMETPEYKTLHESTQYNELASEMASAQFADQYVELERKDAQREENLQKKGNDPRAKEKAAKQKDAALLRAVCKGLKQAQQDVDDLADTCRAVGLGQGDPGNKLDSKRVADTFARVRNHHLLRRIIELAGRYRRVAQGKQRQKVSHGYEDMVGVCLDDSVDRLLSEELVNLLDPLLEADTLRRLAEKETLAADYKGVEKVGKGPIIVCVDESGSMSGEPICNAKAFALAMAWVARHQKRHCVLVGYSGGTEGTLCVLKNGKWNEVELMDWLEHNFSGGTTMDVPLHELTKWPAVQETPKGKTDLILLTDAIVHVPKQLEDSFLAWKKERQVRCITLLVGHHGGDAGDLQKVSDEVHNTAIISTEDEGVAKCLAI